MSHPSARLRVLQLGVLAQLAAINVVNYMDRTALAIANPEIRHDMGLSLSQMGMLLSAFPLTYALAQLPLGPVIDRLGSRLLLGFGIALWSIAQGLAGLAASAGQMWACRILLGIGEAPTMPSCTKVARRWFNAANRGKPVGVFTAANHLGQVIAAPVLTIMMLMVGWRWMFVIMALLGLFFVTTWFLFYRDPANAGLTQVDLDHLAEGETLQDAKPMNKEQWGRLFSFRTSWGIWLGVFGSGYMTGIYATWLPAYLEIGRHMSVKQAGMVAVIPFTLSVIGGLFAGWATDVLGTKGVSPLNRGRIIFVTGLIGLALFTVLAATANGVILALVWISTAMFFSQLAGSCSWISANAAVPENCVGSFGGIMNCFGYIGGAIAPAVTGIAAETTGSFVTPLIVGATIALVSAGIFWFLPKGPISRDLLQKRIIQQ